MGTRENSCDPDRGVPLGSFVFVLNTASLVVGGLWLLRCIGWIDARAPAGFLLGVPLLVVQAFVCLWPILRFVRRESLPRRTRRRVLCCAWAGVTLTATAAASNLLTFGGC